MPEEKRVLTEEEYAAKLIELYLAIHKAAEAKYKADVEAGKLSAGVIDRAVDSAFDDVAQPYHFYLEEAGVVPKSAPRGGNEPASPAQTGFIERLITQKRLFLEKPDYEALKTGKMTKARASEILNKAVGDKKEG